MFQLLVGVLDGDLPVEVQFLEQFGAVHVSAHEAVREAVDVVVTHDCFAVVHLPKTVELRGVHTGLSELADLGFDGLRHPLRVSRTAFEDDRRVTGTGEVLIAEARVDEPFAKKALVEFAGLPSHDVHEEVREDPLLHVADGRLVGLLEAERESGDGDGEFLGDGRPHDVCRLALVGTLHKDFGRLLQTVVADGEDVVHGHVAGTGQDHVVQVVKALIALVQKVCRDVGDGLLGAGDVDLHRVFVVEGLEQVEEDLPARLVEVHADLLPDDALFLLHRCLREVGVLDEVEEDLEVLLEVGRAGEEVTGAVEGRVCVGAGTGLREPFEGIQFFAFKEFVLEEVGRAPGQDLLFPAFDLQRVVDGTEIGPDDRIGGRITGFRVDEDSESGLMVDFIIGVAQKVVSVFDDVRHLSPPPRRLPYRCPSGGTPCRVKCCSPSR